MKSIRWFHPIVLLTVFLLRWQLLQMIAWTSMLVRYSWANGLAEGWKMTFDGQHPCPICHAIASGSAAEAAVLGTLANHPSLLLLPAVVLLAALSYLRRPRLILT